MNRNISLTVFTLFVLLLTTNSQAQLPILWERTAGGTGIFCTGEAISTDQSANVYVTGQMDGIINFSTTVTFTCNQSDIFIAKYDKLGNLIWAKQAGSADDDYVNAICTDALGNSYITGTCPKTAQFDAIVIPDGEFLAKYDPNGNCIWAVSISCIYGNKDVCVDGSGNVYVLGTKEIAKFNSTGYCTYVYPGFDIFHHAMCYGNGFLYTAGTFKGTVTVGTTTLTSNGDFDVFVVKYDTSGNVIWAKSGGGPFGDNANDMVVDASGNCYVLGDFFNSATFGPYNFFKSATGESFVLGYDASGNITQGQQGGTNGSTILLDASGSWHTTPDIECYDVDNNLLITGDVYSCQWAPTNPFAKCIYVRKRGHLTGISQSKVVKSRIYPNPANEQITIDGIAIGTHIELYDMYGQKVFTQMSKKSREIITLSQLVPGNYMLILTNADGERSVRKISKE